MRIFLFTPIAEIAAPIAGPNESEYAGVAQQVERVLGKDEVGGPSPLISSKEKGNAPAFLFSILVRRSYSRSAEMLFVISVKNSALQISNLVLSCTNG